MKINKSFLISFFVGIAFVSIGTLLCLTAYTNMGLAFFFFLPLAVGISSGTLPDTKSAIWGTVIGLLLFLFFLIVTHIEGIVCILMATPIVLIAVLVGWIIGKLIKRFRKKRAASIKMSVAPILLYGVASFFEVFSGSDKVPASVSTTLVLQANKQQVYQSIIQVDTVDVETSFLQKVGLPTPRKCVLTKNQVGGQRLCHFEEGIIVEEIIEMKENEYLRMKVTHCKLGHERSWLKFDEDIYHIKALGDNTTAITRTTTYASNLRPRKYWEMMEAITIKAEQDFVFRNLKKDISL